MHPRGSIATVFAALFLLVDPIATHATPYRTDTISIVDSARNRLVVFGGHDNTGFRADVWAISLASLHWTRLNAAGVPPGVSPKAAFLSETTDEMIVLGATLDSVWALSLGASPSWRLVLPVGAVPPNRNGCALGYDPIRKRIMMFAGATCIPDCILNDLWAFDLASAQWIQLRPNGSPSSPSARTTCAAAYDAIADRFISIGGNPNGGTHLRSDNTVWAYSPSADTWGVIKQFTLSDFFFPRSFMFDAGRSRMAAVDYYAAVSWSTTEVSSLWSNAASNSPHTLNAGASAVAFDSLMNRVLYVAADGVWQAPIAGTQGLGWALLTSDTTTTEVHGVAPGWPGLSLAGARPNPSHDGSLEVAFTLDRQATGELELLDVTGRLVKRVALAGYLPGSHVARLAEGRRLAPGTYLIRLMHGGRTLSRRAVVVR